MKGKHDHDDDLEARLRRDPRRDPTDPPPAPDGEPPPPKVEVIDSAKPPSPAKPEPEPEPEPEPTPPSRRDRPAPIAPERDVHPPSSAASIVTSSDTRIPDLEKALASGDWDQTLRVLGPPAEAGKLPPNLGILFAIAMKEKDREDMPVRELNDVAIRCTASLLGVPHDSAIALLVAKRLIRRNPVAWQKRKAPPPTISILIIIGTVVFVGLFSWLISFGYLQVNFRLP